jgi:hypothetical protein
MKKWNKAQQPAVETTAEPVKAVPPPATTITPLEAGPQKIREAIDLLSNHSASKIPGSILHDAVKLLEEAYDYVAKR